LDRGIFPPDLALVQDEADMPDHRSGTAAIRSVESEPQKKTEELTFMKKIIIKPRPSLRTTTNAPGAIANQRDRDMAALCLAYPEYPGEGADEDCRGLFETAIDNGADPGVMIAAAAEYAKRIEGNGDKPQFLCFWLRCECWLPENAHKADQPKASNKEPRFGWPHARPQPPQSREVRR
jgi:hypothetical protein